MHESIPAGSHPLSRSQSNGTPDDGCREICNALGLYIICPKTKCRRANTCRGEPGPCIRRHAKIVPREVWDWVKETIRAQEDELNEEETREMVEPHVGAYRAWVSGLTFGRLSRR